MDREFNLCIWNLRGLNHPVKQKALKNFMQKHGCAFGGFLETRIRAGKFEGLRVWRLFGV